MKTVVIEPGGKVYQKDINTYEEMVAVVGGPIQALSLRLLNQFAYVNEDGKGLELPLNQKATGLCKSLNVGLAHDDYIVGNFIVVGPPDEDGNETDVHPNFARALLETTWRPGNVI